MIKQEQILEVIGVLVLGMAREHQYRMRVSIKQAEKAEGEVKDYPPGLAHVREALQRMRSDEVIWSGLVSTLAAWVSSRQASVEEPQATELEASMQKLREAVDDLPPGKKEAAQSLMKALELAAEHTQKLKKETGA